MSEGRVLREDELRELDEFVKRNDIYDFDDIVSLQECYDDDVSALIATIRDRDKTIAEYREAYDKVLNHLYAENLQLEAEIKRLREDVKQVVFFLTEGAYQQAEFKARQIFGE
jgi:hypothetical protein